MGNSIKSIVVGYLVFLLATAILGLPGGYLMAVLLGSEEARAMLTPLSPPMLMIMMMAAVCAGYVAARLAGEGELLHGALAILLGVTLAAVFRGTEPDEVIKYVIYLVMLPLFGLLGGYLRLRQVSRA